MRIFSTIAAIGAAALFGGSAYAAGPLGIATSNPGSLYHNIGTAIAKAANSHGLNVTIQPATSPNQYLPAVGGVSVVELEASGIVFGLGDALAHGDFVTLCFDHGKLAVLIR